MFRCLAPECHQETSGSGEMRRVAPRLVWAVLSRPAYGVSSCSWAGGAFATSGSARSPLTMSPRRIVLGSSAGVRNGVLPSRGSRRRAASVVGSGFGRGVGSSMFDCTAVLPSAALFEDCVRGVDMGRHQGGIGPVRDVRVQLCHVVLESVSGPGPARRADEYECSVGWCRSLIRRGRGRANYDG